MWQYRKSNTHDEQAIKYVILMNEQVLTFSEVISGWQTSGTFRTFYNSVLVKASFKAFYWETPPVTNSTQNDPFEFILVNSEPLSFVKPEPAPFEAYFQGEGTIVDFKNLRGDAHLVVPRPISYSECYSHLAAFVRKAPEKQIDEFWKRVGQLYQSKINSNPIWLSTAGLGVSWLHARIDSYPKYYRFAPYKKPPL